MRKRMLCDARFDLSIEAKGPLLIKSGDAGLLGPDMSFVRTLGYDGETPRPYIPGTSLKGVFRSQVERIARTLRADATPVCLPYALKEREAGPELSCGKRFHKKTPRDEVYRKECLACRMFGSLEFKGRVYIDDAYSPEPHKLKIEVRDGVAIDRKTGGAAGPAKYDLEVLTHGTFTTTVSLENFESWQVGAIGLVLRDLVDERIRLGMGTSRGLGHVKGSITGAQFRYPATHDARFVGIADLVSKEERDRYGLFSSGVQAPKLPDPELVGIWHRHRLGVDELDRVLDAGRDEFVSFMKQYKWDGGAR